MSVSATPSPLPLTREVLWRSLKIAAIAAEGLVLSWLLVNEGFDGIPQLILALLGAGLIVAISLSNWPLGALVTLLIASAMPRFTWMVAGLHARPEHVAIGLTAAIVVLHPRGRKSGVLAAWRNFDFWLAAYLMVTLATSALASPEPHLTLRWAVLGALGVSPYFLVRWLVVEEKTLISVFRMLLLVGVAEAAYGTFSFACYQLFGTRFGIELEQYGEFPGTYGTQYEANLFGSYTACCALMCLAGYLLDEKKRRRWYLWGFSIAILGSFISLARAVFLAFPVAVAFITWFAARKGRVQVKALAAVGGAIVAVLLLFGPFLVEEVQDRFSTLDFSEIGQDESTARRVIGITVALSDVKEHPWFGTGANSFRLLFDWEDYWPVPQTIEGNDDERGAWIGNTPVRILHDTGVLGLGLFAGFLWTLFVSLRGAVRSAKPALRMIMIALSTGLILYAITFQATDATTLSFAWIHIGLLAAAAAIVQRQPSESASPTLASR
jgi:O-antigen ligase